MNQDQEFRIRSDSAKRGKGFVGERGGNGTLTRQQIVLADATGYVTEFPVVTGVKSWRCALMDLANPPLKIAIEVDGSSHRLRSQQNRDRIKERMLANLGWLVLRFTNEKIDASLDEVLFVVREAEKSRHPPV